MGSWSKIITIGAGMCLAVGFAFGSEPQVGAELRSFANSEKLNYLSLNAGESLGGQCRLQLNGTFALARSFAGTGFAIAHGGSDLELLFSYLPKEYPISLSVGVAVPNTPARGDETDLTYRASYHLLRRDDVRLSLDTYGVGATTTLWIVGASGSYKMGSLLFKASCGAPAQGNNSISVVTGQRTKVGLYSVGVEWTLGLLKGDAVSLAITNQLGWTTGMSATPALGGNPGIAFGYTVKF